MNNKDNVLIFHNRPDSGLSQKDCSESDTGVLEQVEAVSKALKKLKLQYRTQSIGSLKEVIRVLSRASEKVVFNLVETIEGSAVRAGLVPSLCEAFGRACTGCDTHSFLLSTDKWQSKAVLSAAGLPCPRAIQVEPGKRAHPNFSGPYIIKPVAADASEGIDNTSIVKTRGIALDKTVRRIHTQFKQAAIVEQFIDGREFNITVLCKNGKPMVMPVAEIDFSAFSSHQPRIVGYEAKWKEDSFEFQNTPRIVPARVSRSLAKQLTTLAAQAAVAVGCMDYCRVDFRVDKKNHPYILEVNANPDISLQAGLAAAIAAAGIEYHRFIRLCIDNAIARTDINLKVKTQKIKQKVKIQN
jgi:D-alanine-D-alanine ligase